MGIVAVDLFCGCGGVTQGLQMAGVSVAAGIDIEEECRLTFTLNNPETAFISADLRKLAARTLWNSIRKKDINDDDFLLFAACAPCQPFSTQNRLKGDGGDRAVLVHVARLVHDLRPDFLFLENVRGIQQVQGYSAFRRLLSVLKTFHYHATYQVIDAVQYGVPQSRKRLVLLASLHGVPPWPVASHGQDNCLLPYVTVRETISRYPTLKSGETHATVPNHIAARLDPQNLERIKATPPDGGSRCDWPVDLFLKCHVNHRGHPDVYGRLRWDSPAPTLTTKCTSISNGRFGHPEQDRAISAREAAALQGFEDGYVFYGGLRQITKQIGNAVPPILASKFGTAFVMEATNLGKRRKAKTGWRGLLFER